MFPISMTRRALLGKTAAVSALAAVPAAALAATTSDAALAAALATIADQLLQRSPETATLLGMDSGRNAALAGKLSDISAVGEAEDRRTQATARRLLETIPRDRLQGADINNYDSAQWALGIAAEGATFDFGFSGTSGGIPYVVSQQNGNYSQAAEFLDTYHRVEDAAGLETYFSRLEQVAPTLAEESRRIAADAGKGVVPPDFIVANTLGQQAQLRAVAAADSKFVTSIANRAKKLGLPDPSARATAIVEKAIYPALDAQMAALKALKTNDAAGVWKLPNGDAYYQYLLKSQTTTSLSAAEIHQTGWEQNRAIEAEMDKILRAQGLTQGSVGERAAALTADKRFLQPDSGTPPVATRASLKSRTSNLPPSNAWARARCFKISLWPIL